MQIRELDLADPTECESWYAAWRTGYAAGREAPFIAAETAVLTSLRSNATNPNNDRRAYGAWDGESCLGAALVSLPRQGNGHLAEIEVGVPPEARRRGVGSGLFDAALAVARAEGRSVISAELDVPEGSTLEDNPGGRFALARGFTSEHSELRLLLDVPLAEDRLSGLEKSAHEKAEGYRTVSWTGLPPREWIDSLAEMNTLMELDVPRGDLDREPLVYDVERVMATLSRTIDLGYGLAVALVLSPEGKPAAYTVLFVAEGDDAIQDNTFVLRAHRGRRLGTLAKAANLRQLAGEFPRVRHVHTWTARVNDAMRTVNERFGFRAVETMHELELRIPAEQPGTISGES